MDRDFLRGMYWYAGSAVFGHLVGIGLFLALLHSGCLE